MSQTKGCEYFCEQLSDYLDGDIGKDECLLFEEHLRSCPPCAIIFESLRTTVSVCCQGVAEEIPEDVRVRLKAFLREHCQKT
jgi:predicted anti-sigma-YlaC factor YlaD